MVVAIRRIWRTFQTKKSTRKEQAEIKKCSKAKMGFMIFPTVRFARIYVGRDEIRAAYDLKFRTIYINYYRIDFVTDYVKTMTHELVHHLFNVLGLNEFHEKFEEMHLRFQSMRFA